MKAERSHSCGEFHHEISTLHDYQATSRVLYAQSAGMEIEARGNDVRARAMDELAAGVVCYGTDGKVEYVNDAARAVFGEVLGQGTSIVEVFGFEPHAEPEGGGEHSLTGRVALEAEISRIGSTRLKLGYSVKALMSETDPLRVEHYVVLFRDLTEVSELRRDRERYLRLATMSRLLATIAHEIKNPLSGILGIVEVLLEELRYEDIRADLQLMLDAARQLQMVVDRIRLTEQRLDASADFADLVTIIDQTKQLASSRANHLKVGLSYVGPRMMEARLQPELLYMILINLVNNALDASQRGDEVTIVLEHMENGFVLEVRDTGKGMPPSALDRATELFFTTKPNGTGIGLALSNDIIQRSGGTLSIQSEVDRGTTVRIELPAVVR